ncbi:MAG: hypothetical protein ACKO0V_08625 [bacterium]
MSKKIMVCLLGLNLVCLAVSAQDSTPADQPAMKLAKELTEAGVALFIKGDSKALAEQYMDDAEILITTIEPYGAPTVAITRGREKIDKVYELAPKIGEWSPKNEVHFARFITPELLQISGFFQITENGTTKRFQFTQIRRKVNDKWKIVTLELTDRK